MFPEAVDARATTLGFELVRPPLLRRGGLSALITVDSACGAGKGTSPRDVRAQRDRARRSGPRDVDEDSDPLGLERHFPIPTGGLLSGSLWRKIHLLSRVTGLATDCLPTPRMSDVDSSRGQ